MITIVKGEDWHGVYNDAGDLIAEGHRLSYEDIADAAGVRIVTRVPNQEWLEDQTRLPKILFNVKLAER